MLGVPQPQVSDWENDRYSVLETLTLVKIAKGLRCSVDQLLVGVDPDYDRVRETGGVVSVEPTRVDFSVETPADIPVVAEGDAVAGGRHLGRPEAGADRNRAMGVSSGGPARSERLRGFRSAATR